MERGLQEEPVEYGVFDAFTSTHLIGNIHWDQPIAL